MMKKSLVVILTILGAIGLLVLGIISVLKIFFRGIEEEDNVTWVG